MTNYELSQIAAKNRSQLTKALNQQRLLINQSIKTNDDHTLYVNVRVYIILYISWFETSLQYIIHFYTSQLNDYQRDEIKLQRTLLDRWEYLIDLKFREYYLNNKDKDFSLLNLGHTHYHRYQYLDNLLTNEIGSFIEIRNKLAHGQWKIALNNERTEKVENTTAKIWTLDKKDTLLAKNILKRFVMIVEKLVASQSAFEKTFDKNVDSLEQAKYQFATKYDWILESMKAKYNSVNREIKK